MDMGFGRGSMGSSSSRTKRMRTSFKHHQLRTMKSYFAINHNPDAKDLKQLSQKTGLPKRVLQVRLQFKLYHDKLICSAVWHRVHNSSQCLVLSFTDFFAFSILKSFFSSPFLWIRLGLVSKRSRKMAKNDDEAGGKIDWWREGRRIDWPWYLQPSQSLIYAWTTITHFNRMKKVIKFL